jgi:DNA repair protein RadA
MAKSKTVFMCQNCGAESAKWVGRCPACGEWNTYVEEPVLKSESRTSHTYLVAPARPISIDEIEPQTHKRIQLGSNELNRILGGGIVPGSVILLGGEPGIGKSTLTLQIALDTKLKVLYVSGEESVEQIKLRADRLKGKNPNCYILSETLLENILKHAESMKPDLLVVDSIQTLYTDKVESSPGSVSQIRETAANLLRYAKETATPIFIIGHITKDGSLAGPKVLEHIVDVVLQFEGDNNFIYRIIRAHKNRFGSTSELGIFEMQNNGLREVENPSEILISHRSESLSGVAIAATIDGIRPFLIETQALVSTAAYGTPQRSTTGFDIRRLNMLLAVLEKRVGFKLASKDVFLNIAGGLKVTDPAIDLAVIAAILSSNLDAALPDDCCFAGEVGLSGEIRPVTRLDQRINEAAKLGFKRIFISGNLKNIAANSTIQIVTVGRVEHLVKHLFSKNQGE